MEDVAQQSAPADVAQGLSRTIVGEYAVISGLDEEVCFLETTEQRRVEALPDGQVRDLVNLARINDVPRLNDFFAAVNRKLLPGGFYTGCVQTASQLKRQILKKHPRWLSWPYYVLFCIVKRVFPKLKLTRKLYQLASKGRSRVLSETEVLGRLVYCGFNIVEYREIGEELYFTVQKAGLPSGGGVPSYGPVFKMRRIGRGGQPVYIYKLRTMHPYAEYLQVYIHAKNNLQSNGKFNDDFRVATWGRFLRKTWIDELPMILNWLRGDIKLVGVRPLSEHYLGLYPEELLKRRLLSKPGLLPPFYADLPEGFDAILASETRYLEAYEKHPFRTDVRYLSRILHAILIKRARSQ